MSLLFGPFEVSLREATPPKKSGKVVELNKHSKLPSPLPAENSDSLNTSLSPKQHPPQSISRDFDCDNYDTCLSLSAALNWNSFSCENCCGCVNKQLLWRAHQEARGDKDLAPLYNLPSIKTVSSKPAPSVREPQLKKQAKA